MAKYRTLLSLKSHITTTLRAAAVASSNQMACVDDFERHAERTMPSAALGYFQGGADDEVTLSENVAAFKR